LGYLPGLKIAGFAEHSRLRGNAHLGAHTAHAQPLADYALAFTADVSRGPDRIALRRVDHPPAVLVEPVKHGETGVLIGRPAKHVTTEDERNSRYRPMACHANFSRIANSASAASAAPAPLLACAGSARTSAWASFSTVRMPLPMGMPSIVRAMIPRALSPATISKW